LLLSNVQQKRNVAIYRKILKLQQTMFSNLSCSTSQAVKEDVKNHDEFQSFCNYCDGENQYSQEDYDESNEFHEDSEETEEALYTNQYRPNNRYGQSSQSRPNNYLTCGDEISQI